LAPGGQLWLRLPFFTATGAFTAVIDWGAMVASDVTVLHGSTCASATIDQTTNPFGAPIHVNYVVPQPGFIYIVFTAGPIHGYTVEFTPFFT
jgi:hypothetical protein